MEGKQERALEEFVGQQGDALRQRRPPETRLLDGHGGGDPRAADSASAVEVRPVLLVPASTGT